MRCDDNDGDMDAPRRDAPGDLDAVKIWELQIQQDGVGRLPQHQLDRLVPRPGPSRHAVAQLDQLLLQAHSDDRVVFDHKHIHWATSLTFVGKRISAVVPDGSDRMHSSP